MKNGKAYVYRGTLSALVRVSYEELLLIGKALKRLEDDPEYGPPTKPILVDIVSILKNTDPPGPHKTILKIARDLGFDNED